MSEELVAGEDVGVVSVDDGGDGGAGVGSSDGDSPGSGPYGSADIDFSLGDASAVGEGLVGGSCFGVGVVDVGWVGPVEAGVFPLVVVEVVERCELLVELVEGFGGGSGF